MAGVRKKGNAFYCTFRFQGKRYYFTVGNVTIREKKRVRGKRSTRTAPITPKLAEALREWLAARPESPFLFCQAHRVTRSKTKREGPTAVTKDEAHDHFKRTVAESKWQVLRGFHVLRHSFISALASQGVDRRVIDEVVGHQSEEQRKRYRHRFTDFNVAQAVCSASRAALLTGCSPGSRLVSHGYMVGGR